MLEEMMKGLSTPCRIVRKYSTLNERIREFSHSLPDECGFMRWNGEPYWLDIKEGRKLLYYVYVVGKPPFNSMPSVRMPVSTKTLREGTSAIIGITDLQRADKIVVPEAMAFHIGATLASAIGISLVPVSKEPKGSRRYMDDVSGVDLEGEIRFVKTTGYEVTEMFMYGIEPGEDVVLLDSIISTGGTGIGIINGLRDHNIEVVDFATYVDRVDYGGTKHIEKKTGLVPKSLINLWIKSVYEMDGKPYAETVVEKSRWWDQGEASSRRLNSVWAMLQDEARRRIGDGDSTTKELEAIT